MNRVLTAGFFVLTCSLRPAMAASGKSLDMTAQRVNCVSDAFSIAIPAGWTVAWEVLSNDWPAEMKTPEVLEWYHGSRHPGEDPQIDDIQRTAAEFGKTPREQARQSAAYDAGTNHDEVSSVRHKILANRLDVYYFSDLRRNGYIWFVFFKMGDTLYRAGALDKIVSPETLLATLATIRRPLPKPAPAAPPQRTEPEPEKSAPLLR
jgi:hypothetical protein